MWRIATASSISVWEPRSKHPFNNLVPDILSSGTCFLSAFICNGESSARVVKCDIVRYDKQPLCLPTSSYQLDFRQASTTKSRRQASGTVAGVPGSNLPEAWGYLDHSGYSRKVSLQSEFCSRLHDTGPISSTEPTYIHLTRTILSTVIAVKLVIVWSQHRPAVKFFHAGVTG